MGPGGAVRGLDCVGQAKICAWELASVVVRGLQGASCGFRGPTWPLFDVGTEKYVCRSKVSNTILGPKF